MTVNNLRIENLIIDMDGVLWHGETPVPGLSDFFDLLAKKEIGFVLATNNATKMATQYSEKLSRFGISVAPSHILSSGEATGRYIKENFSPGSSIYVVGEENLRTALAIEGCNVIVSNGYIGDETQVDAVVIGLTRKVCYDHLENATHLINRGATFIGTNPDVTFPSERGNMPGAGALIAFVQTATNVEPIVIGKPNKVIFEESLRIIGGNVENTVMIGDRLSTDILGAHAVGLRTALLLSGVTTKEVLGDSDIQPTWVFKDLSAMTTFLASAKYNELT